MIRFPSFLVNFLCLVFFLGSMGEGVAAEGEPLPIEPADVVSSAENGVDVGAADNGADTCMDSCGESCADCYVDCCPAETGCCSVWTVEAGALFLGRDRANAQPSPKFYGLGPNESTPRLLADTANAELGTTGGYDITLTRCLGPCWDIEARYFMIGSWNDAQSFADYQRTSVQAYGTTQSLTAPGYGYSSQLYNFELSMKWKYIERMPISMGFRTLGLDETFQIRGVANDAPILWAQTSTNNGLYGLQIGMEPVLWDRCGAFRIEGIVKTGVYGNTTHQRTTFPTVGGHINSTHEGAASFVGELGLVGSYRLNKYWSIRGGYEVMWITNVALAPDQSAQITYGAAPVGVIDNKAIAFYYGATASVERRF